jgi:hypothetical protein
MRGSSLKPLGRKVIYRLQRIKASGIYGDDYNYKTLWDEYCQEAQSGPVELLAGAWHVTILPLLDDVVERIPRHAALLLSIAAAWELDEDDAGSIGAYWPDGIREVLRGRIREEAGQRNLYQFGC